MAVVVVVVAAIPMPQMRWHQKVVEKRRGQNEIKVENWGRRCVLVKPNSNKTCKKKEKSQKQIVLQNKNKHMLICV